MNIQRTWKKAKGLLLPEYHFADGSDAGIYAEGGSGGGVFPPDRLGAWHLDNGYADLHGNNLTVSSGSPTFDAGAGFGGALRVPAGSVVRSSITYPASGGVWMGLWCYPSGGETGTYYLFSIGSFSVYYHVVSWGSNSSLKCTYPGGSFQLPGIGGLMPYGYFQIRISDYTPTQKLVYISHSTKGEFGGACPWPSESGYIELYGGYNAVYHDELEIYYSSSGTARAFQPTPSAPFADFA